MVNLSIPRGTRDFGTKEAIARKEVIAIIEEMFKRFGFSPIETPSFENLEVLNAKSTYGEESLNEIFKLEGEDAALRYDLTVPLARFVAMNKDLPMPFKRYQIANVWRKEEPQKMRYREFVQADVDIVGTSEISSDAELIALGSFILDKLGIEGYEILVNDRILLNEILYLFNVPKEKISKVIRLIDKIPKIGSEEVKMQLSSLLNQKDAESIVEFILKEDSNEKKIELLEANINAKEEVKKFKEFMALLDNYGLKAKVVFDLSLVRGIDYYTSFVWEFVKYDSNGKRLPTLCAGGRYDNLLGIFSGEKIPATGMSVGLDRVMDIIGNNELRKSYAQVFIAYIGDNLDYAIRIANVLRSNGIYTDMNITKRGLSKQLDYINSMGIRYAIIVGDSEKKESKLKLRDMLSGSEELLSLEEAINVLKGTK